MALTHSLRAVEFPLPCTRYSLCVTQATCRRPLSSGRVSHQSCSRQDHLWTRGQGCAWRPLPWEPPIPAALPRPASRSGRVPRVPHQAHPRGGLCLQLGSSLVWGGRALLPCRPFLGFLSLPAKVTITLCSWGQCTDA